jgi:hypothetical protein
MEYYLHIASRINVSLSLVMELVQRHSLRYQDSGVGVRKRVIKLLTGIFSTVADSTIRTKICCRLIVAMDDSYDIVKVCLHLFHWVD